MSQRGLLTAGIVSIAAAVLIGACGLAIGGSGFPIAGPFVGSSGKTISLDQAQQSVQSFLNSTGDQDLKIDELMEFQQNFYALIKEKSTGVGAFELLVSKSTGAVGPEPGPNMMWNTKYSMMGGSGMMAGGGFMGGGGPFRIGSTSGAMSVGAGLAAQTAQSWLDQHFAGDSAGTADAFYGYYTFHFMKNDNIEGMLSVNGYSGQVWYHTWHGAFIRGKDFGA
jgi:hypothetical protein